MSLWITFWKHFLEHVFTSRNAEKRRKQTCKKGISFLFRTKHTVSYPCSFLLAGNPKKINASFSLTLDKGNCPKLYHIEKGIPHWWIDLIWNTSRWGANFRSSRIRNLIIPLWWAILSGGRKVSKERSAALQICSPIRDVFLPLYNVAYRFWLSNFLLFHFEFGITNIVFDIGLSYIAFCRFLEQSPCSLVEIPTQIMSRFRDVT